MRRTFAGMTNVPYTVPPSGLWVTMVLALVVHIRRGEMPNVAVATMLLVVAALVAWGRFGDYAF